MLENILALFTALMSLFSPLSHNTPAPVPTIEFSGDLVELNSYRIYLTPVKESDLSLIPNFTQKLSSISLIKENNCKMAINGGFYDTDNNPLGLLVVNSKQLAESSNSKLFNGYVWSERNGLNISSIKNSVFNKADFAFQTGPYFQKDLPAKFDNTKHARRILLTKSINETVYIVAIVGKENDFDGPTLDQLHELIFKDLGKYNFVSAINLDGGSASAFYLDGFALPEFSPIGALICIK